MNFEKSKSAPHIKNTNSNELHSEKVISFCSFVSEEMIYFPKKSLQIFFLTHREWKRACFHADNVVELLYQCSFIFLAETLQVTRDSWTLKNEPVADKR